MEQITDQLSNVAISAAEVPKMWTEENSDQPNAGIDDSSVPSSSSSSENSPKCNRCRKMKPVTEFETRKNGERFLTCKSCRVTAGKYREKSKCEHGRQKKQCRPCGGSSFCEHDRQKHLCRLCGGTSVCEHDKIRSTCVRCHGPSICEHLKRRRECKNCEPHMYLAYIIKARINNAIHRNSLAYCPEHLGCTIGEYKNYISEKFTDGMCWDNYGEWELDHIKPTSIRDLPYEEFIKLLHYTNTQPLWAKDNLSKGNRYSESEAESDC